MPFDLNRTTHVFQMTQTGDILRVVVKDPKDTNKLSSNGNTFSTKRRASKADFSDPATLHGQNMPGIRDWPQIHPISG